MKKQPRVQFRKAKDGWRWRVRARNGRIVAESGEGYSKKLDAIRGARITSAALYDWWVCGAAT